MEEEILQLIIDYTPLLQTIGRMELALYNNQVALRNEIVSLLRKNNGLV